MTAITRFPKTPVTVIFGINQETGRPVWLFEASLEGGILCLHDAHSLEDARQAVREFQAYGFAVFGMESYR